MVTLRDLGITPPASVNDRLLDAERAFEQQLRDSGGLYEDKYQKEKDRRKDFPQFYQQNVGVPQLPVTLASMGQRYKDLPPTPFADRFGVPLTPEQERALSLQLFQQEHEKHMEEQRQLQRTPEYTWPAGFIRL